MKLSKIIDIIESVTRKEIDKVNADIIKLNFSSCDGKYISETIKLLDNKTISYITLKNIIIDSIREEVKNSHGEND